MTDISSFAKDLIKNYPKNLSWHEHIVKRGETLSEIANARGNITAQDIIRANGLSNTDNLRENQIILVPNFKQGVEDTLDEVHRRQMIEAANNDKLKPIRVRRYMVTAGDSLWSISRKFNVDVNTIKGSNHLSSMKLGPILRIPNQDGIFYVLKNRETIEEVAKRYGVSMTKIMRVNEGVDISSLKVNDEIFLPGAKPLLREKLGRNVKRHE